MPAFRVEYVECGGDAVQVAFVEAEDGEGALAELEKQAIASDVYSAAVYDADDFSVLEVGPSEEA